MLVLNMRRRVSTSVPVLVLLLAAVAAIRCAASPAWPPPEEVSLSDEDFILDDPYTGHFRSRFWYFNAALVDGTDLTLSLFQWRYGLLGGEGLLVLSKEPDGETYALETKLEGLEVASDRLLYRFSDSVLEGDREGTRIRLRLPDFSCDLNLRNQLNPWKPGDGYMYMNRRGDAYTRLSVTSPFAEVSGSLEVRGRWRLAEGYAYADRGVVAMPLSRINPEQSTFRVFGPAGEGEPWMLSLSESATHRAYGSRRVATLLLARGGEWLMATSEHEFRAEEYRKEDGAPFAFPHRFRVRARQDGRTLEGEFTVSRLFYLHDILRKLPPAFRPIAEALIRRPVIYRLEGGFSGTLEEADGSRVTLELRGQGEYQVMR
jgi:hypothetical protein